LSLIDGFAPTQLVLRGFDLHITKNKKSANSSRLLILLLISLTAQHSYGAEEIDMPASQIGDSYQGKYGDSSVDGPFVDRPPEQGAEDFIAEERPANRFEMLLGFSEGIYGKIGYLNYTSKYIGILSSLEYYRTSYDALNGDFTDLNGKSLAMLGVLQWTNDGRFVPFVRYGPEYHWWQLSSNEINRKNASLILRGEYGFSFRLTEYFYLDFSMHQRIFLDEPPPLLRAPTEERPQFERKPVVAFSLVL
jgi:hypothetical protein